MVGAASSKACWETLGGGCGRELGQPTLVQGDTWKNSLATAAQLPTLGGGVSPGTSQAGSRGRPGRWSHGGVGATTKGIWRSERVQSQRADSPACFAGR